MSREESNGNTSRRIEYTPRQRPVGLYGGVPLDGGGPTRHVPRDELPCTGDMGEGVENGDS